MEGCNFEKNINLKKYNTLGLGGNAKYYFAPANVDEFLNVIKKIEEGNIKYFVLGGGSNVILPDEDFDGVIISLKKLKKIKITKNKALIDSGINLGFLNNSMLKKGYTDFTWAAGIPGTLGGALFVNAGAYDHDMYENLVSINVYKNKQVINIKKKDIKYGYRTTSFKDEIILSAEFIVFKGDSHKAIDDMKNWAEKRISTQPLDKKNAGSTFKNPENNSAGKLIDECGLKGFNINGAEVSTKHANFIINEKNATSKDIKILINHVKDEVKNQKNIDLELENKIINWNEL